MRKFFLVVVVAVVAAFTLPAEAQISVNVNIGSRPQYVPVRYVSSGYYYNAPARPVYINNVYRTEHSNWRPARTHYVSRPVMYKQKYYKNDRGHGPSHYKFKSQKHGGKMGKQRGRR
ncbi:MAG: hypothetical protein WKF66_14340 [Pedobacter sp.]